MSFSKYYSNIKTNSTSPQNISLPNISPAQKILYQISPSKKRALIPKLISFFVLGTIFYLGILLNISLLDLTAGEETFLKTFSLIILTLVVSGGLIFSFWKAHLSYFFYNNKIIFGSQKNNENDHESKIKIYKEVDYSQIIKIEIKKNIWDKIFQTYSLKLDNQFSIKYLSVEDSAETQLQEYIQQMIDYNKNK